jgi:GT2 family glycosyltransferase
MTAGGRKRAAVSDVTVVVPAWGTYGRDFLPETLRSIALQRPKPLIVVVDNNSTEPLGCTGAAVVRTGTRVSVGAARNAGLAVVKTPYVVFWDADDVMIPGTLGRLRAAMGADVAIVATRLVHDDGSLHHWPRMRLQWLARHRTLYAAVNAVSSLFPLPGGIMRTAEFRAAGGFPDVDAGDDWVAGVSMALRGRVAVLCEPGRLYRQHETSMSAGWTTRDRLRNARHVRLRLARELALPRVVRALIPALAPLHWVVLLLLRPTRLGIARLRRRREPLVPVVVAQQRPAA